jgi:hypothetical protein
MRHELPKRFERHAPCAASAGLGANRSGRWPHHHPAAFPAHGGEVRCSLGSQSMTSGLPSGAGSIPRVSISSIMISIRPRNSSIRSASPWRRSGSGPDRRGARRGLQSLSLFARGFRAPRIIDVAHSGPECRRASGESFGRHETGAVVVAGRGEPRRRCSVLDETRGRTERVHGQPNRRRAGGRLPRLRMRQLSGCLGCLPSVMNAGRLSVSAFRGPMSS